MVIHVKDHLAGCTTNSEGEGLLSLILGELSREGTATVDFHGVLYVSTSFVNSAFVALLDRMSFEDVKTSLRVVRAYPQIAEMIRNRLTAESALVAA